MENNTEYQEMVAELEQLAYHKPKRQVWSQAFDRLVDIE